MAIRSFLISLIFILFTSACGNVEPLVRANAQQSLDMNQYQTFGFLQPLDTDENYSYETLISQYLKQATVSEMTKRGYKFTESNPDLLINFHRKVEDKRDVISTPAPNYYTPYGYYYNDWPNYETYSINYKESTLKVDIIDREKNTMIWEGIATGRLTEEDENNLQTTLQKKISKIFSRFPI